MVNERRHGKDEADWHDVMKGKQTEDTPATELYGVLEDISIRLDHTLVVQEDVVGKDMVKEAENTIKLLHKGLERYKVRMRLESPRA